MLHRYLKLKDLCFMLLVSFTIASASENSYSHEHNAFRVTGGGSESFDPLESSASYQNVLNLPIRNFTKVATIKYSRLPEDEERKPAKTAKPKPSLVLTLSLQPYAKFNGTSTEEPHPFEAIEQATSALITHTIKATVNESLGSEDSAEAKNHKGSNNILDRLRSLTNSRLRNRNGSEGLRFGIKSFGPPENKLANAHKSSSQIPGPIVETTLVSSKVINQEDSDNVSTTEAPVPSSSAAVPTTKSRFAPKVPRLPPISSILGPKSTTPIVVKVGPTTSQPSTQTESFGAEASTQKDDKINTGETRFAITADQLSGNRPTSRPFHFTTPPPTPPPPSTTTLHPRFLGRGQRLHSPHNHAYAPTQDPVSDVQEDLDLSVEEFQDIRVANLLFGNKVGSGNASLVPQLPPPLPVRNSNNRESKKVVPADDYAPVAKSPPAVAQAPVSKPKPVPVLKSFDEKRRQSLQFEEDEDDDEFDDDSENDFPVNPLLKNTKNRPSVKIVTPAPTPPPTTQPPQIIPKRKLPKKPEPASSGVDNSLYNDNDNSLPFYREPGGVFKEHKYHLDEDHIDQDHDDDLSPNLSVNQVAHNSNKSPKVKYAPQSHQHQLTQHLHQPTYPTNNPNLHQQLLQQPQPIAYIHHQQPQPHQNIYYQPVAPTPIYQQALPQAQLYPAQPSPAFIPIQQLPLYQQNQQHQQQPLQFHGRNHNNNHLQQPIDRRNSPQSIDRKDSYSDANFPSPDDPESDSFYGDPRPDTNHNRSKNPKKTPPPAKPLKPPTKSVPRKPQKNNNKLDSPRQEHRPPPQNQNQRPRGHNNNYRDREEENAPPPRRNNNNQQYNPNGNNYNNDRRQELDNRNRNQNRNNDEENFRNNNRNQKSNKDNFDTDYDNESEEDLDGNRDRGRERDFDGDFNNQRPIYDQPSTRNEGNVRQRLQGQRNGGFRPSPVDHGPVRASQLDHRPNFDHPNIQYPNRNVQNNNFNRGPEFDPRGFGVGYGPSPGPNVQLDPIYTKTIKQYDEDLKSQPPPQRQRQQEQRRPEPEPESDEHHGEEEEEEDGNRGRGNGNRNNANPSRNRNNDQEEEEEEGHDDNNNNNSNGGNNNLPEEEEEHEDERRPARPNQTQEPQEEEEEEEEEEAPPPKKQESEEEEEEKQPEEEEEEEEEEDDEEEPRKRVPLGNRQRQGSPTQQGKQVETSKKPPQNEKSGDLEDDIKGIEQEFGGIFG